MTVAPGPAAPTARWLGSQRVELEACASTNDEAARLARAGASHGTVVIAARQTAGRGRDGRVWASSDGGLYLSAVVRPPLPLGMVPPMTLAIGVGVCDAARSMMGGEARARAWPELKWPNDVLVGGRKLAGVLVEAQSQGSRLETVIVGIGVNLSNVLPDELAGTAITLAETVGAPVAREAFVACLLAHVERWIDRYVAGGTEAIVPAWQERMARGLEARATIDGAPLTGLLAGIDPDGALLVHAADGRVHRVRSGDVEVLRPQRSAALA